jgi:hypothetical protein
MDHIVPLAWVGADKPSDMQWQTIREPKEKGPLETGEVSEHFKRQLEVQR